MKTHILTLCALAYCVFSFAQQSPIKAPTKIPKSVKAFMKNLDGEMRPTQGMDDALARLEHVTPGLYHNTLQLERIEETELMNHLYSVVPIFRDRNTDHNWFYEQIAVAFSPNQPFYQRFFYYEKTKDGIRRVSFIVPEAGERFFNFWEDKKALEALNNLKIEELRRLPACDMEVRELSKGYFAVFHPGKSCHDPALKNVDYIRYELHYFEGGNASRPMAFDKNDEIAWGYPEEYYIFERRSTKDATPK